MDNKNSKRDHSGQELCRTKLAHNLQLMDENFPIINLLAEKSRPFYTEQRITRFQIRDGNNNTEYQGRIIFIINRVLKSIQ